MLRLDMASEDLIAKKDVLELTGISYGQFYRWKRQGLIPEEWFVRRATFTGQETFLPRTAVLERITDILRLKDTCSFDEIAAKLDPRYSGKSFDHSQVAELEEVLPDAQRLYAGVRQSDKALSFDELVVTAVVGALLQTSTVNHEQVVVAAKTLHHHRQHIGDRAHTLTIAERFGMTLAVVHDGNCLLDPEAKVLAVINLEETKKKLSKNIGSVAP